MPYIAVDYMGIFFGKNIHFDLELISIDWKACGTQNFW